MKRIFKTVITLILALMFVISAIQVGATSSAKLSTNKTEYEVGDDILVTATGSGKDWVAIYENGVVPGGNPVSIYWYYVADGEHTSGETYRIQDYHPERPGFKYTNGLPEGKYVVYLFENDSYNVVTSIEITVGKVEEAALSTNKTVYAEGESIMVTASGSGLDWVGVYEKDIIPDGDPGSIYWYYVNKDGYTSGETYCVQEDTIVGRPDTDHNYNVAKGLPAGEYDIYLLLNDGYTSAAKITITVVGVSSDNLTTDKKQYLQDEDIYVTATGMPGQKVGIYKANEPDGSLPIYEYELSEATNGVPFKIQSGVVKREEDAKLLAGSYKICLISVDATVEATVYIEISLKPYDDVLPEEENKEQIGENGLLKTDKIQYKAGEAIMVTATVTEQQANELAWVGIVPKGITVSSGGAVSSYWYYVNDPRYGAENGAPFNIFNGDGSNSQYQASYYPIRDGYYDIYLFAKNGYEVLDKVTVSIYYPVIDVETDISLEKTTFEEGEAIYVTASSSKSNAWVGVFESTAAVASEKLIHWYWVSNSNGIAVNIIPSIISAGKALPAGEYKIILFNDDGFTNYEKTITFEVVPADLSSTTYDFTVNGNEFESENVINVSQGETIIVNPTVVGKVGYSWVGVYNGQYSSDFDFSQTASTKFKYVRDINGLDWNISDHLAVGINTVVLFADYGYDKVMKVVYINVKDENVVSEIIVVEPTCESAGLKHIVYKDGSEEDVLIFPLGHKMIETSFDEPTPDQLGGIIKTCENCGHVDATESKKFDISNTDITVENTVYSGEKATPKVTVLYNGTELIENTHFEIECFDAVNAGTAVVKIFGIGNCTGEVSKTFTIERKQIVPSVELSKTEFVYNGKNQKPVVTILNKGVTDYTVFYPSKMKNVGTYTIDVELNGNYSGTSTVTYKIIPKSTTIKTLKGLKKSITVKWAKKTVQTTGYQIIISTNKNFKNAKKYDIKSSKTDYKKIKKLKSDKKYFVKIRTYKTVGKTKYYSNWSKSKSIRTK